MLENKWGGAIYIFVSVCFFVMAGLALYYLYEIVRLLELIYGVVSG